MQMISQDSIKSISLMFCGDIEGFYSYKSGPKLVNFFNQHFHFKDVYAPGFPSRWNYVYNKLVTIINNNTIDSFFNIILSKQFLMGDLNISMVEAAEKAKVIYYEINRIIKRDFYVLSFVNGNYHLLQENQDLRLIGSGGFAKVYYQKSTGLIIKKLKDDYLADIGIRSRFKREFNITKSLQDLFGIIQVYSFNEDECSYTMERAETTLEEYVKSNELSADQKKNCIQQILYIMAEIHKRNIIHRDISPNNIFILSGMLKLADFGLGKDLNVFASHQTFLTNAVGQFLYCAPEQFMMLKEADKRSDVYSLGRVINFIMTKDPGNYHHIYGNVANKAACADAAYRYADAPQLAHFFEQTVLYYQKNVNKEQMEQLIKEGTYNSDVDNYIYALQPEKMCKYIMERKEGFSNALMKFMNESDDRAQYIIQAIESSFRDICGYSYAAYDPFAAFSFRILKANYSFIVKEIAATILRYVAKDVNRFSAQDMIENLISEGIDPLLEEMIQE